LRKTGPGFALSFSVTVQILKRGAVAMEDVLCVLVTLMFFALAWAYAEGCDRL